MIFRELTKEDAVAVESILDLYWSGDFREHLSQRLRSFLDHDPEMVEQNFQFFVAEDDGEVIGVGALRKATEHMREYTSTENPGEFYVSAVKEKGKGVGSFVREKRLEEARKQGYTEVVFFSGKTHKDSWAFHDDSEFVRVSPATAPNGEEGYVWRMELA